MWDDALRAYAEARKVKPELTADMAHWTCRVLLKQQQGPEALRVARAALEKVENPELKVQLLYDEADAMYAQPDQRRGALDAYKNLGESHKDNPLAGQSLYNAAYAALDLHEFVQCQQLCDEFIRDFPKHELLADVQHLMAETSLQQGNAKDAESAFAKLIEAFPEHPEVDSWRVQVGRALLAQSAYDQVIDRLTDAIPSMSSSASIADAWLLVGDSQAHLKKYDEAKVSLQRSLKAYPRWRNTDRLSTDNVKDHIGGV